MLSFKIRLTKEDLITALTEHAVFTLSGSNQGLFNKEPSTRSDMIATVLSTKLADKLFAAIGVDSEISLIVGGFND